MATNDNTQVNSFIKGMNSDVSYSMLLDGQYTFAKNIRITQMNKTGDGRLTNGQGDIRPIEGVEVHGTNITPKQILATGSIRDTGVIIYTDAEDNNWKVAVFKNNDPENILVIFDSEEEAKAEKFSIVLNHEMEDLDKLYIADGVNPIKLIPIKETDGNFVGVSAKEVESYPKVLLNPPHFSGLVDGQLKAGMVQYAYRLYKRYGISTDVSPTTNLIPIVNNKTLTGYSQGHTTNSGVELFMEMNKKYSFLDRILIFRVHYEENGQLPIISIVYDDAVSKLIFPDSTLNHQTDPNGRVYYITFIDEGRTELGQISLEEFNSMLGQRIIPKVIESKNDYMFAAQIKDVQSDVFKGVTAESLGIKVKQVTLDLVGDASPLYKINGKPVIRHNTIKRSTDIPTWDFKLRYFMEDGQLDGQSFKDQVLSNITLNYTYSNPAVSYYLKSLRRGETYRYGIVLYDERGNSSGVIPFENDIVAGYEGNSSLNQAFSFGSDYDQELIVHPLGIEFEITGELPENAVAYEIVRCRRTEADTVNISQGVISKPLKRYRKDDDGTIDSSYPYTPSGFITVQDLAWVCPFWPINDYYGSTVGQYYANNFSESNLVQFISPETSYLKDTFQTELQDRDITLKLIRVLYSDPGMINRLAEDAVNKNGWINLSANNTAIPIFYTVDLNGDSVGYKYMIDNYLYTNSFYKLNHNLIIKPNLAIEEAWQYIAPTDKTIKYDDESTLTSMSSDIYSTMNEFDGIDPRKSIKQIKQQAYSYIKLYNSSAIPKLVQTEYSVEDCAIANELQWNDIFEDNKEQITNKYEDFLQSVGTNQFNNVVIGGLYGVDIYRLSDRSEDRPSIKVTGKNYSDNHFDDLVFAATGGRCALLNLSKPLSEYTAGDLTDPRNFYTYLCSIQKQATPYGKDKKLNTYYSYGSYYTADNKKGILFDGDTFIQPLEYISMHKTYFPAAWDTVASHMVAYSIPVETSINLAYTSGCELSREYNNGSITNIQIEPADVYSVYGQGKPLYVYNSAYSNNTTAKMFATAEDEEDSNAQSHMDYRVMYSNLKSNGEYIDSWLKYQPANYLDVDSKYGEITHLRKFNNKLFFWQDSATGLLSVNERTQITDESNLPLILGNGGVLDRYDYIDDTAGMKKELYCDTMSDKALYWYDDHNNEIKRAADGSGLMSLTKAYGVQNIMHTYDDNNKPWMFYDKKYNEVVLDLSNTIKQSIVFNENINAFTSIYDVGFDGAVTFKDGVYLLDVDKISERYSLVGEDEEEETTKSRSASSTASENVTEQSEATEEEIVVPTTRKAVAKKEPEIPYINAIDLGLSVKWADRYLGAPDQYSQGLHTGWGDITGEVNGNNYSDYTHGQQHISGNANYDIATAVLGPGWRLPTRAEYLELVKATNLKWYYNSVTPYFKAVADNGNEIFFSKTSILENNGEPVRDKRTGAILFNTDYHMYAWTGDIMPDFSDKAAYMMNIHKLSPHVGEDVEINRQTYWATGVGSTVCNKLCIRPVYDGTTANARGLDTTVKYVSTVEEETQEQEQQQNQGQSLTTPSTTPSQNTEQQTVTPTTKYTDSVLYIGKWNEGNVTNFDGKITTYIEYVVNKNPLITKVFDNQEIVSNYLPDIEGPDKAYFSDNCVYSWRTNLNAAEDIYYLHMTNREGNYRFAIPRAKNAAFGDRIRGKYMICSIEDTAPEVDASISYIITKFRTSWS